MQRKPKVLSGGQRQRVALGRAMVRTPQVYLFDEPLSNLDARLRMEMRLELKRLHERMKRTSIYVTHDQVEAMAMGDRIVVMKEGRIQQVGEPLELFFKPANRFVAGFIGSPPMNFVGARVHGTGDGLSVSAEGLTLPVPKERAAALAAYEAEPVILGIRSDDFSADASVGERCFKGRRPVGLACWQPDLSGSHCGSASSDRCGGCAKPNQITPGDHPDGPSGKFSLMWTG